MLSGYRDEHFQIIFTTIYEDVFSEISEQDLAQDTVDFEQLIAVKHIISAKRFDLDIYERFQDRFHR